MIRSPEHHEELEITRQEDCLGVTFSFSVSRRSFLQTAGAGIALVLAAEGAAQSDSSALSSRRTLGARIRLGEDGAITVLTGKVEVGQGARAQLTQAAAEELRVPTTAVRLVMADTAIVPNDGGTFGSLTTPRTVPTVRRAAAAMRELLVHTASARWRVKASAIEVVNGTVHHPKGEKSIDYADLAQSKTASPFLREAVPGDAMLTSPEQWRVLGTPVHRSNAKEIVTGRHHYPSDIRRPGMRYGKVLRPPSYGARLTGIDPPETDDIQYVIDGTFAGVVASTSFAAQRALDELAQTCSWEEISHPSSTQLFDHLKRLRDEDEAGHRPPRAREEGSIESGLYADSRTVQAE